MQRNYVLEEIAHQAMVEKGFVPDFSPSIEQELDHLNVPAQADFPCRDLRHFLWVSIDNETSQDLDQLTYAEKAKIFIAIADVDSLVKQGSSIDERAAINTTSVYTPTKMFPMLPLKLSTQLTSLNPNSDRLSLVVEVHVEPNGRFTLCDVYHALVRNQAKLSYPSVGAWLEEMPYKTPLPMIDRLPEQLKLQDRLAQKIQEYRNSQGALEFKDLKLQTVIQGKIPIAIEEEKRNRAHKLIENFMIAANVAVTHFLKEKKFPILRRVVRVPKHWNRIVTLAKSLGETLPSQPDVKALRIFLLKQQISSPLHFPDLSLAVIKLLGRGEYVLGLPGKPSLGHFDLSEQEYTHATAPNRRFPDLIMQRLIKKTLLNEPISYTIKELETMALHCTQMEDAATKLERRLSKCAIAIVLQKEIGRTFRAMVTGASPKGTWVRVEGPPIEGKLTKGFKKVDVGDFLQVKLIHVDVLNGHIDFARVV